MKFKLKNGMEVDLHDDDIKTIMNTYKSWQDAEEFDSDKMLKYFEDLHKHAISKMETISEKVITDEDSIDIAAEHVAKHGTYKDFVKFMRYSRDYDIAWHILQSFK